MNPTAPTLPLAFWRAMAAQLRGSGPCGADARRLLRLIDLHQHLTHEAGGPDGALAEVLAASLLPAIEAAVGRLSAQFGAAALAIAPGGA